MPILYTVVICFLLSSVRLIIGGGDVVLSTQDSPDSGIANVDPPDIFWTMIRFNIIIFLCQKTKVNFFPIDEEKKNNFKKVV